MPDKYTEVSHRLFLTHFTHESINEIITGPSRNINLLLVSDKEALKIKSRSPFEWSHESTNMVYVNVGEMLRWKIQGNDFEVFNARRTEFINNLIERMAHALPDVVLQVSDSEDTLVTRKARYPIYSVTIIQHSNDDKPEPDPSVITHDDFLPCSSENIEASHAAFAAAEGTPPTPRKPSRHDCVGYVPRDK